MGGRSGGGGSPQPQEMTTYTTRLPEYAEPYWKRLMSRTEGESNMPYSPYPGQRLAYFSPQEEAALGAYEEFFRQGAAPETLASGQALIEGLGALANPAQWSGEQATAYMTPYMEDVLAVQKREAKSDADKMRLRLQESAAKAGAFGGYGYGTALGELDRTELEQMSDIEAMGRQQAYTEALGAFQADREAKRAAAETRMAGAQAGAQMGGARQASYLDRISQLEQAGQRRRQLRQAGLDVGYEDFLNQLGFPRQQLGFYSQVLRGLPVTPGSNVMTYAPSPSGLSSALGFGLGALGMMRGMGGMGGYG